MMSLDGFVGLPMSESTKYKQQSTTDLLDDLKNTSTKGLASEACTVEYILLDYQHHHDLNYPASPSG